MPVPTDRLQFDASRLRSAYLALIALNVAMVWLLPVLPLQDLPQHLAYARILQDFDNPALPFASTYAPSDEYQLYFTTYSLIRWLSLGASVEVGVRALVSLYVVGFFAAFAFVTRVAAGNEGPSNASVLLATILVWSPPVLMGFLAYFCGLPLILAAVGGALSWIAGNRRMAVLTLVASGASALIHPFIGATTVLCLVLCALVHPPTPRRRLALYGALAALVVLIIGHIIGRSALGEVQALDLSQAWRQAYGLEFISIYFGLEWSGTLTKVGYAAWAAFGPFTVPVLVVIAVVAAPLGYAAIRSARATTTDSPRPAARTALLRIAVIVALLGWLGPFGIHKPTELTFINLRLIAFALTLGAAAIPARAWSTPRLRASLAALMLVSFAHLAYRMHRAAAEASAAFELLDKVERGKTMMSLMINNDTDHLAKLFRSPHFVPMYYTVRYDGLATQFWAQYTHHLPVGYQPGKRPVATDDWLPGKFEVADLAASDYVLVRYPSIRRDPDARLRIGANILRKLETVATEVDRRGLWALYRVRRDAVTRSRSP